MERYNKFSYEREATDENNKENEENMMMLYAAAAAAGTSTIAMAAWAKNLGAIMLIMEQWRVQVFLLLNFILLAIFLTSLRSSSASPVHQNQPKSKLEIPSEKKAEEAGRVTRNVTNEDTKEKGGNEVDHYDDDDHHHHSLLLSKEELNERAEAFIAMFREHLVRDAAIEVRDLDLSLKQSRRVVC